MKKIQAYLLIVTFAFVWAGTLTAESSKDPKILEGPGKKPGEYAGPMLGKLQSRLALTPDQIKEIQKLAAAECASLEKVRGDANLTREQRKDARRAARERMNAGIRQILTPEQRSEFDQIIAERKAKR